MSERKKPGCKPNPETVRHTRSVRWSDAEWSAAGRRAVAAGLTRSAYIRACALGEPERVASTLRIDVGR